MVQLLVLVALLAGCQLRVATDVVVEVDGSGSITLTIVADDELRDTLVDAGVDLRAGLDEAAAGASWSAEPVEGEDATGVELSTSFATPEELGARVEALFAGLTTEDGVLLRDVELEITEDGGYVFAAEAGILPPAIVGSLPLDEDAAGRFDGDDLARALEEGGDELAVADLRVTFPTVPVAPGAEVQTTSATWSLPVHELATVGATAPPVPLSIPLALMIGVGIAAALLAAFVVRATRRR